MRQPRVCGKPFTEHRHLPGGLCPGHSRLASEGRREQGGAREIRDDIHEAFLSLASAIICWRRLRNLSLC
jgi:hypothetical protein